MVEGDPSIVVVVAVMVQLQTFTPSDYLLKKIALIIISCKIERKNKLFHSLEISKNKIF